MQLKIRSNFSFAKLARQLPGLIEKHSSVAGVGAAKGIKTALEAGKFERLRPSTIDIRRKGGSPNAGFMATTSTKPLIHTGSLRNSIRVDKEGIKMHEYGKFQNDGYITSSKSMIGDSYRVPPRPFITQGLAIETPESKEADKELSKNIRKALMK